MNRDPSASILPLLSRRRALQVGAVGAVSGLAPVVTRAQSASSTPIAPEVTTTGKANSTFTAFDTIVIDAMTQWSIPGGQLAIGRDDRLVYSRGYGAASVEDQESVELTSRFRIASTSKPFTGVAILMLVDAGKLTLDTPVFPLLELKPAANAPRDSRIDTITVEHLLVHAGGWDSAGTGIDPQYLPWTLLASNTLNAENPASAKTIVEFMQSQPLDFAPGTRSAYSNLGFNILGRVIEHVSGMGYEEFVNEKILQPAGITSMAIGGTTLAERLPDEVRYYSPPGLEPRPSIYPGAGYVPVGYGSYYLRALDAHGGWIATAEDLIRFAMAIDGRRGTALLTPQSLTAMSTTPRPPSTSAGAGNSHGEFGLAFTSSASATMRGGWDWTHSGALEGSNASWLLRTADGSTAAFVFNSLPSDFGGFFSYIVPGMQKALSAITDWPTGDLFS
jgi:N-acyl-D-amino-acid deacylase